jgi:hypothetical protein
MERTAHDTSTAAAQTATATFRNTPVDEMSNWDENVHKVTALTANRARITEYVRAGRPSSMNVTGAVNASTTHAPGK